MTPLMATVTRRPDTQIHAETTPNSILIDTGGTIEKVMEPETAAILTWGKYEESKSQFHVL